MYIFLLQYKIKIVVRGCYKVLKKTAYLFGNEDQSQASREAEPTVVDYCFDYWLICHLFLKNQTHSLAQEPAKVMKKNVGFHRLVMWLCKLIVKC